MTSSEAKNHQPSNPVRSTSLRIIVPVALTLVLFILSDFFLFIPYMEKHLLEQKRETLRTLTDSCWSLIAIYHDRIKRGELTLEEAQARVIDRLRGLRYGPEGKDYFWINDMTPRMVMHPHRPDLEGKDLSHFTDSNGKRLFKEFVDAAKKRGDGYVDYIWQWKDDPSRMVPKISYVKAFAPWGWVIGTGMYVEDIRSGIKSISFKMAIISSGILTIALVLSILIIWQSVKRDQARKKAEEGLRDRELEFQALGEDAPFGISITDPNQHFVYLNPKFTQLFGYTITEIPDKQTWFEHAYPDLSYREKVKKTWSDDIIQHRGAGEINPRIFTVRCKNGEDKIIQFRAVSMRTGKQLLTYQDITDQARMEASLKESERKYIQLYEESKRREELYRSLLNSSADAIVVYDIEGYVQYVSPAFTQIFGWEMDEIDGKRIPFVPDSETEPTMRIIRELVEQGKPCSGFETKRFTKDGRVLDVSISASRYDDHEGKPAGMLVVIRNISERKTLEAQFHEAQKMESIGTLAGGVAHDFNNLLMAIQGNISLLLLDTEPGHPNRKRLHNIEDHIQRGAHLTKQLLGFARGGKYEITPTDMNDIIRRSTDLFSRMKKEIKVHTAYQEDIEMIEADQGQMEQVLMNLYVNSAHAMPNGGDLRVVTQNVVLTKDQAVAVGLPAGPYVRVSVADTGIGIDPEVLPKIFDPFFTTREVGQGTGLGLASAYGIIKNHGGAITVRSVKGMGTTFDIYLPASGKEAPGPVKPGVTSDIVHGGETILLVYDEDIVLEVGQEILERLGYRVLVATNGSEAIELYRNKGDRIDLVILDMIMPDMTGIEAYNRLKKTDPAVTVLLSSGYSLDGHTADILKGGRDGFIQKPFSVAALSQKIREILDSAK